MPSWLMLSTNRASSPQSVLSQTLEKTPVNMRLLMYLICLSLTFIQTTKTVYESPWSIICSVWRIYCKRCMGLLRIVVRTTVFSTLVPLTLVPHPLAYVSSRICQQLIANIIHYILVMDLQAIQRADNTSECQIK